MEKDVLKRCILKIIKNAFFGIADRIVFLMLALRVGNRFFHGKHPPPFFTHFSRP